MNKTQWAICQYVFAEKAKKQAIKKGETDLTEYDDALELALENWVQVCLEKPGDKERYEQALERGLIDGQNVRDSLIRGFFMKGCGILAMNRGEVKKWMRKQAETRKKWAALGIDWDDYNEPYYDTMRLEAQRGSTQTS